MADNNDCKYRGDECGWESSELACCTDDRVTLYACEKHGTCTLGPYLSSTHPQPICCLCPDRTK